MADWKMTDWNLAGYNGDDAVNISVSQYTDLHNYFHPANSLGIA